MATALTIDTRLIKRTARGFGVAAGEIPGITSRALNHSMAKANTKVKRLLVKETSLKSAMVGKELSVRKSSKDNLEAAIVAKGRAHALKDFTHRQTKKGVTAKVWGKRKLFKSAFIVKKLSGNVFRRAGKKRLPIYRPMGPSIPNELLRGESANTLETEIETSLAPRVIHEIQRALK